MFIGSTAIKHHCPDFRAPKDIDIISPNGFSEKRNVGGMLIETHWDSPMEYFYNFNYASTFPSLSALLTLKMSHVNWDIEWNKHMSDIRFMQENGALVLQPLYHGLVERWIPIHGKKRVNTNMSNEQFFSDAVKRKYDHDWLHEQVAYDKEPAYKSIQIDVSSPHCSEELFQCQDALVQFNCYVEEVIVTAIERFNLTKKSTRSERMVAVSKAQKKLITTMSSGWFALYCIEYARFLSRKRHQIDAHLKLILEKLHD